MEPPAPQEPEQPSTPHPISTDPDTALATSGGVWKSPAFRKSARRISGNAIDFAFDPFTEEDGFVSGKGRKRPRYSLQRTDWRVMDEPDSPQEHEEPMDWEKALQAEIDAESDIEKPADIEPAKNASVSDTVPAVSDGATQTNIEDPFQDEPSVFVKPSLHLAGGLFGKRPLEQFGAGSTTSAPLSPFGNLFNRPTDTPQLRPVPSPGLPIPSPLVSNQGSNQEYFAPFHTVPPAHDFPHGVTSESMSAISESGPLLQNAAEPALHGSPYVVEQSEAVPDEASLSHPTPPVNAAQVLDLVLPDSPVDAAVTQMPSVNLEQFDSHIVADAINLVQTDHGPDSREELHMPVSTAHTDDQSSKDAEVEVRGDYYESNLASESVAQGHEEEQFQGTSPPLVSLEMALNEPESYEDILQETADQEEEFQRTSPFPVPAEMAIGDGESESESEFESDEDTLGETLAEGEVQGQLETSSYASSRSGSDSRHQSDAEDEARYDEDVEAESYPEDEVYEEDEQMGYEDEIDADKSEVDENEAPGLPPAQPEVIVLDSDSEDELASEQPTAASPHHVRQPSLSSEVSESSAEYDREDRSAVEDYADHAMSDDQEPEQYESEDEYDHVHLDQDERVDHSDMDDESSSDVLVRDDFSDKRSTRDHSAEEGYNDEERREPSAEGDELEANVSTLPDVEAPEDEPGQANDAPSPAEEPSPQILAEKQDEPSVDNMDGTSGGTLSALISLDGARDWPRFSKTPEEDLEPPLEQGTRGVDKEKEIIEAQEEGLESDEPDAQPDDTGLPFDTPPLESTQQQLPTPDPTQEVPGYKSGPENEQIGELVVTAEQNPPMGLNLRAVPGEFVSLVQQEDAELIDVVLPTTEPTDELENDGEQDLVVHESAATAPKTPIVVFSKPPVPDRNAHGLRSKFSYFAPLATLVDHYNALVDTISIVYEASPVAKATSGSKDYFMTIYLTDPSMAGTMLAAQIFRRYKSAMPSVTEGQAILLRDFKVLTRNHSMTLVSIDSSSWAVFDGSSPEAKMTGPPVEYGSEERAFASGLRRWYLEYGEGMVADRQLQASIERDSRARTPSSVAASDAGSLEETPSIRGSRRSRRSHRRVTIHELRDGTRYTEVGSPSGQHDIHELRDGTVYVNE